MNPLPNKTIRLCNADLAALAPHIVVPAYQRGASSREIVHIGVGGFNRAHMAVYLDDLLPRNDTDRWTECGLGLLPGDSRMRDALLGQDCLYTLVERSGEGQRARVIGSINHYVYAPDSAQAAIERMASPACGIVSLTITEGGYLIDGGSSRFNANHPDVLSDLAHPDVPKTFAGYLAEALNRRRLRGQPPFTVMSCDNIQKNGDVAKSALLAFAEMRDSGLRRWIEDNVAFPNSMVDRITPTTTELDRAMVRDTFGVEDSWPVMAEPFRQWVLEDQFCDSRPPWELVGVQLAEDVTPFEITKMRLLNGGHLAVGYLAALLGYEFVHEAVADPLIRRFLIAFMQEVVPIVPPASGMEPVAYSATLVTRFSNPMIRDQVERICSEASAKIPKFLLPSIRELLAKGEGIRLLCLVVALWIQYRRGRTELGDLIPITDASLPRTAGDVADGGLDAAALLSLSFIFGEDLPRIPAFTQQVEQQLKNFAQSGVRPTLELYLSGL